MCTESNETYVLGGKVAAAHAVCSLTLALLGTLGNGLSIFLILRGRLHTTSLAMMLLVELCIANMISTAFVLPLIGIHSILGGDWPLGDDFCAAYGFIMYTTLTGEIGIMLAITVNQYVIVVRNFNMQNWLRNNKKLKLAVVFSLPWLPTLGYIAPLTNAWDTFGYEPRKGYCALISLSGSSSIKPTLSFSYIIGTLVIIIFCYGRIYWTHHKSRFRTDTTTLNLNNGTGNGSAGSGSGTSSPRRHNSRNYRAARTYQLVKMISLIIANFFLTYIPFVIKAAADPCLERTSVDVTTAVLYIAWSHAATNPLIYGLANRQIRSQWHRLLPCLAASSQSVTLSAAAGAGGDGGVDGSKADIVVRKVDDTNAAIVVDDGNDGSENCSPKLVYPKQ